MASVPDHIAKAMMDIVSSGTAIDESYAVFKKCYLEMDFENEGITPTEWVQQIKREHYPAHMTNPTLSNQSLNSLLQSFNNEIREFQNNNQINGTPATFTIPITIINHQEVIHQEVQQMHVTNQTIITQYCTLKLYTPVTCICTENDEPINVIIKASSKLHAASFATHSTKQCCSHDGHGFEYRCETCRKDGVDGCDTIYKVRIIDGKATVSKEFKQHLDNLHRLSQEQYMELQATLAAKAANQTKNTTKKRRRNCLSGVDSIDVRDTKRRKHKHKNKRNGNKWAKKKQTKALQSSVSWNLNTNTNTTNSHSNITSKQIKPLSQQQQQCNEEERNYETDEDDDIYMKG
eukprot:271131_1